MLSFTRKAGSSSSFFAWKDAFGPIAQRKNQTMWSVTNKVYEGICEWLEYLYAAVDNPEICYTVNIFSDTYENMADLIEFMIGDGTVNYNGGINWAEVRKSYGFENPVNVYCWEIGNELDWEDGNLTVEEYITRGKKAIDLIKSMDPDAAISIQAATDSWNRSDYSQNWNREVLKALGDQTDYLSVHYYYPADFITRANPAIDKIKNDILEITGSDRIKLYLSEHAVAPNSYSYNKENPYDYMLPHTIWGATGLAEWYMRAWLDKSIVIAANHHINSSVWAICYNDKDGITHLTPTGEILKSFVNYGVGDILETKLDNYDRDTASFVSGDAIKSDNGDITLFLLNRFDEDNVKYKFDFGENRYKVKHIRTVHGDYRDADRFYREGEQWEYNIKNDITVTDEDVTSSEALETYIVAPLTLTTLTLEKIN